MRILWVSDSPTVPSGFGNVTRFVCSALVRGGHDVHILGWQNTAPGQWCGATMHGMGRHWMGADVILPLLYKVRPDVLITLGDVWWLTFLTDGALTSFFETTGARWVMYYPIDGNRPDGTLPPSWVQMLARADVRVAMARYGQQVTEASGMSCRYIPHGVETSIFHPPADRDAAKRALGYDGRFVVFSDARNQPRKMLPRLLEIFRRFSAGKDDVLLHLHCDPRDPAAEEERYCYRIDADVELLGLGDKVRFSSGFAIRKGLTLAELVSIYHAADVHLLTSWGEGFGLPTLQSAACGVVPMAIAYTANRELVGEHGVPLAISDHVQDEFGIARAFVDVDDAVAKLETLYRDRGQLRQRSEASVRFAADYDWERITPAWLELLRDGAITPRVPAEAAVTTISLGGGSRFDRSFTAARSWTPAIASSDAVSISVTMQQQRDGELASFVWQDAGVDRGSPRLRIPLARTGTGDSRLRKQGAIHVHSAPASVLAALQLIFPNVTAALLEQAVLALDLDGSGELLPLECARLGVPLIGASSALQQLLWPELVAADAAQALLLARGILTDHPRAAALTGRALAEAAQLAAALPGAAAEEARV